MRWIRHFLWIITCIIADFGLVSGTGRRSTPAWIRDNPFYDKTKSIELRRKSFYIRLIMVILTMGAIYLAIEYLRIAYPPSEVTNRQIHQLFANLVIFVITMLHISFTTTAVRSSSVSLYNETRRQTLEGLLLTGIKPVEMVMSMMTGPYIAGILVAIAALPIYILILAAGLGQPSDVAGIYLFALFNTFLTPVYNVQLATNTTDTKKSTSASFKLIKADQQRYASQSPGYVLLMMLLWVGFSFLFIMRYKWMTDLLIISPVFTTTRLGGVIVSWVGVYYNVLVSPCTFFAWHIPLILLIAPSFILFKIASILRTAANICAFTDPEELKKSPLYRRYLHVTMLAALITFFMGVGITWRAWFMSGDYGTLLGNTTNSLRYNVAGLSLIFCVVTLVVLAVQCWQMQPINKVTGGLRSLRYFGGYLVKRFKRTVILMLPIYLMACLLGWVTPFNLVQIQSCMIISGLLITLFAHFILFTIICKVVMQYSKPVADVILFALLCTNTLVIGIVHYFVGLNEFKLFSLVSPVVPCYFVYQYLHYAFSQTLLISGSAYSLETTLSSIGLTWMPVLLGIITAIVYSRWKTAVLHKSTVRKEKEEQPVSKTPTIARKLKEIKPLEAKLLDNAKRILDNPIFIYQLRNYLRQTDINAWSWGLIALPLAILLSAHYAGDIISFFVNFCIIDFYRDTEVYGINVKYIDLSTLFFTCQLYYFGIKLPRLGETMIDTERVNGTLGFLLITPMTNLQIGLGKIIGYMTSNLYCGVLLSFGALISSLFAFSSIGVYMALFTWFTGQVLVISLVLLCLAVGGIMSTFPLITKILRGISMLIMAVFYIAFCMFLWDSLFNILRPHSWETMIKLVWIIIGGFGGLTALAIYLFVLRIRLVRNSGRISSDNYSI